MSRPLTYSVTWRGIDLAITHTPNKWDMIDHIEIRSADRQPLPITQTGYKSVWLCPEDVAEYESAPAFVLEWLELSARDTGWTGQLSLFSDQNHIWSKEND